MTVSSNKIVLPEAPPGVVYTLGEKRNELKVPKPATLDLLGAFKLLCYGLIRLRDFFFREMLKRSWLRQETKARMVMKENAWSFANPDFRGGWKNFSSHREASRQTSAVSDRIRCYIYKIILWKTETAHSLHSFVVMHPDRGPEASSAQGKAVLDGIALGQEDRIIFPWFQRELHPLAAQ